MATTSMCAAPTLTLKRTTAWDGANDRASKRRSLRACLSCRNRKVRCDVVNGGVPCTNCRLDDVECILKESNRGRKPSAISPPPTATESPCPVPPNQQVSPPRVEQPAEYLVSLSFEDQRNGSQPGASGDDGQDNDRQHEGNDRYDSHRQFQSTSECAAEAMDEAAPTVSSREGMLCDHDCSASNASSEYQRQYLPAYIRNLPCHMGPRDLDYLAEKDALTIPDDDFRDELLRTYVNIVHAFMPALDLEDFLVPIIKGDGSTRVSLLLFQAVMFVAVTFVDGDLLRMRGYSSRKAARKTFFRRVRLLYGLDCEPDRLALIQALLLMTYWYDTPDDEKDTWYWMGITLSLSQVIGVHRDPEKLRVKPEQKRLRRRIWWSCFMRDRLLALGIRRPARIKGDDFNVPMLCLEDFDLGPLSSKVIGLLGESKFTGQDNTGRKMVASTCVELAKLCVCIGNTLHSQYSVLGNHPIGSEYYMKVVVVPRNSDRQTQDLAKCDAELDYWYRNQPADNRYTPPTMRSEEVSNWVQRVIRLHQAILYMIYLTTLGALHRPQAFCSTLDPTDSGVSKKTSAQRVKQAAIAMTKLAFDLQSDNQLRYLPTSSIPAFLSATLIHLLDVRNSDEEVRNVSIGRFYQCVQALHQLQDMYAAADYTIRFLGTVLKSMDINIPMLTTLGIYIGPGSALPYDSKHVPKISLQNMLDHTASSRMATAYATPSSSGNQAPIGPNPFQQNPDAMDVLQSLSPTMNIFDGTTPGGHMGPHPQLGEHLAATPQLGMWAEVDGLLPALINFDADPNMLGQNYDPGAALGWVVHT